MTDPKLDTLHRDMEQLVNQAIDRLTFRAPRSGAEREEQLPPSPGFRSVVACVDGSPASRHVVAWAKALALAHGARVLVATVVTPPHVDVPDAGGVAWWPQVAAEYQRIQDAAREAHERALDALRAAGVAAEGSFATGSAVGEIVRACEAHRADLVVLGAHDRGAVGRLLLGSVADGVKNHVAASVLVARNDPPPRDLLVATDGSSQSRRAASVALRLARDWRAAVFLLHVVDAPLREAGVPPEALLEDALRAAPGGEPSVEYGIEAGRPAARIVAVATARAAGLVVMGSRGLGPLRSLVAGSVSNRVAHDAPTSVLLVKEAIP